MAQFLSKSQLKLNCLSIFRKSSLKLLKQWILLIILTSFLLSHASASITVISQLTNESILEFMEQPARYVPDRVSYYGLRGFAVYAEPANACTEVLPPPSLNLSVNWILIARRLDCEFQTKIENAQSKGYSAIIIHNVGSNTTEPMTVSQPEKLVIYAGFIGEYYGELLRDNFSYKSSGFDYFIDIQDDFSINSYIWPFAIVVAVCFIIMLLFMVRLLWQQVRRWLRERRRSRRRKLPTSVLKKLPISRWTKGDPYETCAVCLEDFIEGDKVRVLPCAHGFHAVCIDPWLTKNRRVCPICKRKVILAEERFNELEEDTDDETTPLLRNPSTSTSTNLATTRSTFVQQRENLFQRAQRRPFFSRRGRVEGEEGDGSSSSSSANVPVLAQVHGSGSSTSSSLREPHALGIEGDDEEDEEMLSVGSHEDALVQTNVYVNSTPGNSPTPSSRSLLGRRGNNAIV